VNLLTKKQIAIRIAVIISAAELFIMLMLETLPVGIDPKTVALIDTASLVILSIPSLYFWVIHPFVNARDEALSRIRQMALTDSLTQLANRRLILEHLGKIIAGCSRHKEYAAILLLDLDEFKLINDRHGHEAGDAVLIEIARRLRSTIRANDVVGRQGGDEFIILLDRLGAELQITRENVSQFANKLIKMINMPIHYKSLALHVGVSIGIRLLGFEHVDSETAIAEADSAMYNAKKAGKGRAVFSEVAFGPHCLI
jgi:two-component system cell cycle response regulator